jgi:predicted kinase
MPADMSTSRPTLHLLCGKIAAGKSTLAKHLASRPGTVLISEDRWNSTLFPDEIKTIDDYSRYSARVRAAMGPHVVALLKAGLSVVLDFQANTVAVRGWMRTLIDGADAAHELHFLDLPDEVCRHRLRERNAAGEHPYQASDADYDLFTRYFVPPSPDEGFNVIVHKA